MRMDLIFPLGHFLCFWKAGHLSLGHVSMQMHMHER